MIGQKQAPRFLHIAPHRHTLILSYDLLSTKRIAMPILLPVRHSDWQILRAATRSRKPLTGRELRIVPTRHTKDGSFLNDFVRRGLLTRLSGSAAAPFEATYALTPLGEYAAEYGECEKVTAPAGKAPAAATKAKRKPGRPPSKG
jgi:hypothetical protein